MLDYPRDEAKTLIKLAFENTDIIRTYFDAGVKMIGKTGPHRVGLFSLSYGEKLIVEIPEIQPENNKTRAEVSAKSIFSFNLASDEDSVESEFMKELNAGRGVDIDELIDMNQNINANSTKEVSSPSQQAGLLSFLS
jgi:hypothetical protein